MQKELARQYSWALKPEFVLEGKFVCFHLAIATKASQQQTFGDEEYLDVVPGTISRWLRGRARITPERLKHIAEIVYRDEKSLVERNDQIAEFEKAFWFLEISRSLGRVAPDDMPQMAKEFLERLDLPTKSGEPLVEKSPDNQVLQNGEENLSDSPRGDISDKTSVVGAIEKRIGEAEYNPEPSTPRIEPPQGKLGKHVNKGFTLRIIIRSLLNAKLVLSFFGIVSFLFVSAFSLLPGLSHARTSLGGYLGGTSDVQNVTELSQFGTEPKNFVSALLSNLGLLILENEAQNGSAYAMHEYGLAKVLGINTPKDLDAGVSLFADAHNLGYGPGSKSFAYSLHTGLGSYYDPKHALEIYEALAEQKNPDALNAIGTFYERGEIKPHNPLLAMKFFEEAENLGSRVAIYNRGRMLRDGVPGIFEPNSEAAISAFKKAISFQIEGAAGALAILYLDRNEPAKAIEVLETAIAKQNTWAMTTLGYELWTGLYLDRDLVRARALFEDATARGNPRASLRLAEFIKDIGLESEMDRIPELVDFASTHGGPRTLFHLGFWAEHDQDLVARAKVAEGYYQRASDRGNGRAAYRLAAMILDGRLFGRPRQDAIDLLEKSVSRGDPYAQWKLATILLDPEFEPTNRSEGLKMLRTAGERGNGWVINAVGNVFAAGKLVELDDLEASAWYRKAFDKKGNDWAACYYVEGQFNLNSDAELATYENYLQAGVDGVNSNCLSFLFSDFDRLKTWEKSPEELNEILERYVDFGNFHAIRYINALRSSSLFASEEKRLEAKDYFDYVERAAKSGSIDAMIGFDDHYFVRIATNRLAQSGYRPPIKERLFWLRKAASLGSFEAVSRVLYPDGVTNDDLAWLNELIQRAEVREYASDQFLIGLIFEEAVGERDLAKAEKWYSLSAKSNDLAKTRLIRLLVQGCHKDPNYEVALEYLSAMEAGDFKDEVIQALYLFVSLDAPREQRTETVQDFLSRIRTQVKHEVEWEKVEDHTLFSNCIDRLSTQRQIRLITDEGIETSSQIESSTLDVLYPYPY